MTYQYHYPAELIDVVHLTNGGRIIIRPVLTQDRELMVAFFHDLSADARCSRFMHPVNEPSSDLLMAISIAFRRAAALSANASATSSWPG